MEKGIIFGVYPSFVKIYCKKVGIILAHESLNNLSSIKLYDIVSFKVSNYLNKSIAVSLNKIYDESLEDNRINILEIYSEFANLDIFTTHSVEFIMDEGLEEFSKKRGLKPEGTIVSKGEVKFLFRKI